MLDYLSHILYSFILSYVICIEVPGYMILSKFDQTSSDSLDELRRAVIDAIIAYASMSVLQEKIEALSSLLEYTNLKSLVEGFVRSSARLKSTDPTLSSLLLSEINQSISSFDSQSKQPLPQLTNLLSLAGLSFLLAEILKTI
jgi:hypothetical protein